MIIVGEKLNSSIPKVARAIEARDAEFVRDLASRQAAAGACYLDVNAGTNVTSEVQDLEWLINTVQEVVDIPLCVDSPNPKAIEAGLKLVTAKEPPMINSITGEQDRMDAILPLVVEAGGSVIALTSDEGGMPENAEDRLAVAGRIYDTVQGYGIEPERLFFDPLVFPLSTSGNNGVIFLNTVMGIKERWPGAKTVSGLSNISYGLPKRKLINRVFLILAMGAGMEAAIMDPLDQQIMSELMAAEALLDHDYFCADYLGAFRRGELN